MAFFPILIRVQGEDRYAKQTAIKMDSSEVSALCDRALGRIAARRQHAVEEYEDEIAERHNRFWYRFFSWLGATKWAREDARQYLEGGGASVADGLPYEIRKTLLCDVEEVALQLKRMAQKSKDGIVLVSRYDLDKLGEA